MPIVLAIQVVAILTAMVFVAIYYPIVLAGYAVLIILAVGGLRKSLR